MSTHATSPEWSAATADEKLEKLRGLVLDLYHAQHGLARARVIATLEAHAATDEKEAADARFIIEMCRQHPNILWANCEAGHITGSALIVDVAGNRVLLNHHKKLGRWMQFGGHAEFETEPWRVALREAIEESGLGDLHFVPRDSAPSPFDIDVHVIPAQGLRPAHYHLDLRYLLATAHPDHARASDESHAIRWFAFAEALATPLEPGVHRMIRKAMARVAHSAAMT